MTHLRQLRARGLRLPFVGGVGGLIAATWLISVLRGRGRRHRPTGAELAAMSDADFAAFIGSTGVKTVTTAGLSAAEPR
jgi:hypothetical protein